MHYYLPPEFIIFSSSALLFVDFIPSERLVVSYLLYQLGYSFIMNETLESPFLEGCVQMVVQRLLEILESLIS